MVTFISIDTIVNDLLTIIRGGRVTQSEPIPKMQIEYWVHQYRALLIKQDMDKGKMPNPDYIQEIPAIKLEKVDRSPNGSLITTGKHIYRTELELPKTIDLNFKPGIIYLGTIDGTEIQIVPQARSNWQKYKKFTDRETIAYLNGSRLYIETPTALSYITMRGVFEIPTEVNTLVNPSSEFNLFDPEQRYPIPINMVPTLKELILKKELGIMTSAMIDEKTDSQMKLEPNNAKEV
jgi:hypothetical protein